MSQDKLSHTLPTGYILHDIFEIESVIGEGGFGITYRAKNLAAKPQDKSKTSDISQVAIKEYYPLGVATRDNHNNNPYAVTHYKGELEIAFNKGLDRFRQEAYLLKEFEDLDSIVTVLDIFEENNTTYIVMEYIEGLTIKKLVEQEGRLPYPEFMELITPLLHDMSHIHSKGLIHRDISPDNLLIGTDNRLHLIDFGSANHNNLKSTKTFTVILKAGYAPPEQYSPKGKIGPWTDVYGLCAVFYFALTGHTPTDSLQRMQIKESETHDNDIENDLKHAIDLPPHAAHVIAQGLSLSYKERYPSVQMLYNALTTPPVTNDNVTAIHIHEDKPKVKRTYKTPVLFACIFALFTIVLLVNYYHAYDLSKLKAESNLTFTNENLIPTSGHLTSLHNYIEDYSKEIEEQYKILNMIGVVGTNLTDAKSNLNELDSNIEVNTTSDYSDAYPKDTVIAQSIAPNTPFTKGNISSITLTISLGTKPVNKTAQSSNGKSSKSNKKSYNVTGTKKDDGYTTIHIGD